MPARSLRSAKGAMDYRGATAGGVAAKRRSMRRSRADFRPAIDAWRRGRTEHANR